MPDWCSRLPATADCKPSTVQISSRMGEKGAEDDEEADDGEGTAEGDEIKAPGSGEDA